MEHSSTLCSSKTDLEKLQKAIARASDPEATPEKKRNEFYDRQLDLSILKIACEQIVALDVVKEIIRPCLEDQTGLAPNQWELNSPLLGKAFTIKFLGASWVAKNKAESVETFQRSAPESGESSLFRLLKALPN